jgi:hypothetical protein
MLVSFLIFGTDIPSSQHRAQNDLPFCSREEGHGSKLVPFIASLFGAAVLIEQEREI